mmetsp:Transcript_23251/g.41940  ORF Transcript_23251/g.41940 Transcript_23251/m.41940 type:complete len:80 (-) Transcript_23251:60-299(-)
MECTRVHEFVPCGAEGTNWAMATQGGSRGLQARGQHHCRTMIPTPVFAPCKERKKGRKVPGGGGANSWFRGFLFDFAGP